MSGARVVDVLEALGTSTLAPWAVPAEHETVLRDVVIHDPAAADEAGEGDLLLAVGVAAADVADLLGVAADRRVAAVVVRCPAAEREALVECARRNGVALLALAPGVGWARLTSQLRSLLSIAGRTARRGPVGAPPSRPGVRGKHPGRGRRRVGDDLQPPAGGTGRVPPGAG